MADLIEGTTGHAGYAPLSHAQTLAISRHLQDQIGQIQRLVDEQRNGLRDTNSIVNALREASTAQSHEIHGLSEGLLRASSLGESNRKELGRCCGSIQKLQQAQAQTNENAQALRDAHKITCSNLSKVQHDQDATHSLALRLQETIERRIDADIGQLRDELSRTNLDLRHLRAEQDQSKIILREQKEGLRDASQRAKVIEDGLNESNTLMKIIEDRLSESWKRLNATKQCFEDLNTVTLRLHEDHENTKAATEGLQGSIKNVGIHVKQVHEELQNTSTALGQAEERLNEHFDTMDGMRQTMEQTNTNLQALKEGHEKSTATVHGLRGELAQVKETAQAVRAGLKETSNLLLPNIHMDHGVARSAAAHHGSLLITSGSIMPGGSPRKSRGPAASY